MLDGYPRYYFFFKYNLQFIEKFKEIKELTRRAVATEKPSSEVNGGIDGSPQPTPTRTSLHQRTNSLSSIQVIICRCVWVGKMCACMFSFTM